MKIIIVGCGKIGVTIIAALVAEGHDVTAVDNSPTVLADVSDVYDIITVQGNGVDYDTLKDAGADKADLLVATTDSDEQNMLSCFFAKRMGTANTIARVRNPQYDDANLAFMRQQLGLSMTINPERMAAREIYHILRLPSAAKIETFSHRNMEMIEMLLRADSPLVGAPLSELRGRYKAKFLICVAQRGDEVFIPDGNFVLQAGDKIGITASPEEFQKLLRGMGIVRKQARQVMLLGGSRTTQYLAKQLLAAGVDVRIIESDRVICDALSEALPKAVVIHGDGAEQELLMEEGLNHMDAFVALTGMDEENILLSFFAMSQNVPKVVAKVTRDELGALGGRLGLECVVSPRQTATDSLVQYARALQNSMGSNVETLYKLMDDRAEALEFKVQADAKVIGIPLKDLALKSRVLVAGILRQRKPLIPAGDDVILPGDKVVVVAANQRLQDLDDILA